MVSTGIDYLDKISGGLKWGDNVVWEVSSGIPVEFFTKAFFSENLEEKTRVVFIGFNTSPHAICKKYKNIMDNYDITLVDAFTHGKGKGDPTFLDFYNKEATSKMEIICLDEPGNVDSFRSEMNKIEKKFQDGTFYFFDSLTGMSELWKDESAVIDFFTFTCPKLFDLNTIAYWIYEKNAHSKEFMASILHTTQVVFSLKSSRDNNFKLVIKKLDGRPSFEKKGNNYFSVIDEIIHFKERKDNTLNIGKMIKEERKNSQMTQTELAILLKMTSGAISQIENDIVVPSINTLINLSEVFNKPVDYFLGNSVKENKNYLFFENQHQIQSANRNVKITRLLNIDDKNFQLYSIDFDKKSSARGPLFLHKREELVTVLKGKISVFADNSQIEMAEGNSIYLKDSFIEIWENNEDENCVLLYHLL